MVFTKEDKIFIKVLQEEKREREHSKVMHSRRKLSTSAVGSLSLITGYSCYAGNFIFSVVYWYNLNDSKTDIVVYFSRTVGKFLQICFRIHVYMHHKVQKFSGISSPGWSRKKSCKTVVCGVVHV